jgi:hypothetical protein
LLQHGASYAETGIDHASIGSGLVTGQQQGGEHMKQLLEFSLESGGSIVVEVDQDVAGTVLAARPGEIAAQVKESFESALAPVTPAAEALIARLSGLSERPDEVTVEFGIKLTGTLNAIIASSAGEANISVKLTWRAAPG